MNDIIVRTSQNEYVGGSVIYGAVYLRIFTPVTAGSLVIVASGTASCKWTRTLLNLGPITNDSSTEANQHDQTKEIAFQGEETLFKAEYVLATFEDATVPIGCYAYPFQFMLMQGLPHSFRKKSAKDEIKMSTYDAAITYKLTAKLQCSSSHSKLNSSALFSVRNEERISTTLDAKFKDCRKTKVKSCFCFPKGELILKVELDKLVYAIGEKVTVKFWVENKSDVRLEFARIKLIRTIALTGHQKGIEDKKMDIQEAFPEEVYNIKKELEMETLNNKYYEISMDLNDSNNEMLSSAISLVVKCRYLLEVEILVPWDEDISVYCPIEVCPGPSQTWSNWKPAEWIKNVIVIDSNGTCKVSRYVLESNEFANVPLPLSGLNL
eukprot:gene15987-17597_t